VRYRILFAAEKVGQSNLPPFEIDVPDHYPVSERVLELSRRIRERVVAALVAAPAHGAMPVQESQTQVTLSIGSGQGAAYYGTTTLGQFNLYDIS
jgi:hypothetical protein